TLDPALHHDITGVGDLDSLLVAVERCVGAGIPCKINTVVMAGVNDQEIDALIDFCEKTKVRCLKLLDVIRDLEDGSETYGGRQPLPLSRCVDGAEADGRCASAVLPVTRRHRSGSEAVPG